MPQSAIYQTSGLNKVFTFSKGAAKEHLVQLGSIIDNMVEVKGDIKSTDKIIVSSVDKLSEGLKVKEINTGSTEK